MFGDLGLSLLIQDSQRTTNELLQFNICRQSFEKRLNDLGLEESTIKRFTPIVEWMRLVIAENAPELLISEKQATDRGNPYDIS